MKKIIYIALYWFIVQMIIAQLGTRISYKFLEKDNKYFRSWNIEQEGQLWQQLVKVQYWKDHLPDGQNLNPNISSKATFDLSKNMNDIQRFILETRRAEVVHLLSIFPVIPIGLMIHVHVKLLNVILLMLLIQMVISNVMQRIFVLLGYLLRILLI